MINYCILGVLALYLMISVITVIAELVTARNSLAGHFFREIRIRLRELSPFSFCVISALALLWGLAVGDDSFRWIWAAVGLLFLSLIVLHPNLIFGHRKRRKKAKKLAISALKALPELTELPELKELPELTPVFPDGTQPAEQKG